MKLINHIIILSLSAFIFACDGEEFIEETKLGNNTATADFESNADLDGLTRGAYWNLRTEGRLAMSDMNMFGDMQSDILYQTPWSDAKLANYHNFQNIYLRQTEINDIPSVEWTFAGAYSVINNTNRVIQFYNENEPFDDGMAFIAPTLQGECYFLRSWAFFSLAMYFAPPYSSDPDAPSIIMPLEPANFATDLQGRSTNQEVYEQMISDLKLSIDLLPEEYDLTRYGENFLDRVDQWASRFLLAKIYFLMGEPFWTSGFDGDGGALEQINAIINSNRFPVNSFANINEAIFAQRGLGLKAPETVWFTGWYRNNAWRAPRHHRYYSDFAPTRRLRSFSMSKAILNEIGWNDSTVAQQDQRYVDTYRRYEAGEDPAAIEVYEDPYHVWSNKFINQTWNFPHLRSPELYLMRAVIRLAGGDAAGAADDINVTRVRAGLPALATATAENIEHEWIKEYAFEGWRIFYLQATQQDVGPGDRAGVGFIPYDDESLVREFPLSEISRNPNLGG